MALIPCYECEKEISDKAPACPHCGAPKEGRPSELEEPTLSTQKHSKSSQEEAVDPNETEWHRNWKNKFPNEWQEIILPSPIFIH